MTNSRPEHEQLHDAPDPFPEHVQPLAGLIPRTDDLDVLIRDLSRYIWETHRIWNAYFELYGRLQDVELLNATAPGFFHLNQQLMLDHCVISICRLLEKERKGKNINRVLASLIEHVPEGVTITDEMFSEIEEVNLKTRLKQKYDEVVETASALQEARNKRIAHRDDASHVPDEQGRVKYGATLGYSYQDISDTLDSIQAFFWSFCLHYDACYRDPGSYAGASESKQLLGVLRLARDYDDLVDQGRIHSIRKRIIRNPDMDRAERQRLSRLQDDSMTDACVIRYEDTDEEE